MTFEHTLSVCIPTYNRGEYLQETLENIYEELNKIPVDQRNKIDICISDNNSSDFTKEIVEDFISHSSVKVIFETNLTNLGPDANFLKAVSLSKSEYVWLLGSDDKIVPGGLNYLCNYLNYHKDSDLIFLYPMRLKSDGIIQSQSLVSNLSEQDVRYYDDHLRASLDVIYEAGLISILCFKRVNWESIKGYEKFMGSWYVHQYKFLSMIKAGAKTSWIRSPALVAYRADNESILRSETILHGILTMLDAFYNIPGCVFGFNSKEHRKLFTKNIKLNFPPHIVFFQVSRLDFKGRIKFLKKFYRYCKGFPFFWYKILPFLIIPVGSNGKFLTCISVNSIAKRFHNY